MNRTSRWIRFLPALAAALLAPCAPAAADCIPVKVPAVIDEPGSYCLVEDFEGDLGRGIAIEIRADHVILDLQGHLIRNTASAPAARGGQGVASWERSHVVVRNGSIAGFWEGVSLGQGFFGPTLSVDHLVEEMRVYDCHRFGIGVGGLGSVIRHNVVYQITGREVDTDVTGIFVSGGSHRVIDNEITRVLGSSPNRWGIRLIEAIHAQVYGNHLTSTWNGILMDKSASAYRDNVVLELPGGGVAFSGGVDLGGNVAY